MVIVNEILDKIIKQKEWGIEQYVVHKFDIEEVLIGAISQFKKEKSELLPHGERQQRESLNVLILSYENALREYRENKKEIDKMFVSTNVEKEIIGTARQSTLAFYYMRQANAFPRKSGEDTTDARFIRFLTGHNFDTIRKIIAKPLSRPDEKTGKATQELIKDLKIIRNQFENIQFAEVLKLIENDINILQNDLESFNPV